MPRQIITEAEIVKSRSKLLGADEPPAPIPDKPDDYSTRMLKFIPAEVVTVYLALDSLLRTTTDPKINIPLLWWGIFLLLLILTPVYLWRIQNVTKTTQLIITTISFAIWVFSLGGPFALQPWYSPFYGALLLPLYTFIIPLFKIDA